MSHCRGARPSGRRSAAVSSSAEPSCCSTLAADVARQQHRHRRRSAARSRASRRCARAVVPSRAAADDARAVRRRRSRADRRAEACARRCAGDRPRRADARWARGRHRHAPPHFARAEIAQQRRRAADMVGIAVRDAEIIDIQSTAGAQRRTDDAIADVEVAAAVRCRRRRPAACARSGNVASSESPWPTSIIVRWSRPSPA